MATGFSLSWHMKHLHTASQKVIGKIMRKNINMYYHYDTTKHVAREAIWILIALSEWQGFHIIIPLNVLIVLFQEPSASSLYVLVSLASTSSSPVTHSTYMACPMTLVTAMAGQCSVPGVAWAWLSLLVSFVPWLHLSSPSLDPPAPSPDRRTGPSAKANQHDKTN